jgi:glyoxylase-like metal-dependent hydrolase (beta-lactamase superfamily II)
LPIPTSRDPLLHQISLPVPARGVKNVFCYLLKDEDEIILIDSGWNATDSFTILQKTLGYLGVKVNSISKIIITHLHPDHFGLSGLLKEKSNAIVCMHERDTSLIGQRYEDFQDFLNELHSWLRKHGTPEIDLKEMLEASLPMLKYIHPVFPDLLLHGGEEIRTKNRTLQVIHTPGHTPGNICIYIPESRVLFSGDHILPTITPNIGLNPQYDGSPLHDYLNSLERVSRLDVDIVFPAHEYSFANLKERIQEILIHHKQRLEELLIILEKERGKTAYEVARKMTWYSGSWELLSPWERRAALMETLAHLEYLKREGKIIEENLGLVREIVYLRS